MPKVTTGSVIVVVAGFYTEITRILVGKTKSGQRENHRNIIRRHTRQHTHAHTHRQTDAYREGCFEVEDGPLKCVCAGRE
jgi:hypothetical protein